MAQWARRDRTLCRFPTGVPSDAFPSDDRDASCPDRWRIPRHIHGLFPAEYRSPFYQSPPPAQFHNGSYRSAPDTAVPGYPLPLPGRQRPLVYKRRTAVRDRDQNPFHGHGRHSCDPRSKRDVPETAHHCPPRVLSPGPAAGIHIWSCSLSLINNVLRGTAPGLPEPACPKS